MTALVHHRLRVVEDIAWSLGAGGALLSATSTVRWLGVTCPEGVHVLVAGGDAVVIAGSAATPPDGTTVERIDDGESRAAGEAARRALKRVGLGPNDALAIESEALPFALGVGLDGLALLDARPRLAAARARKDPDELALIERSAELVWAGQRVLRERAEAGVTELELWATAQAAMQAARGGPVEAVVDLMVGKRTALVGRPPGPSTASAGDPVLFDLAPRRDGYWADSCATFSCGPPHEGLRRQHDVVRKALDRGLAAARPGVRAYELDGEIRGVLANAGFDCPHHTGHGVGTAPQEPPWLTPEDETVLEEGMVVALEPGVYSGDFGVRLEHLTVIESDGARPLTSHSIDLT